MPWPLLLSALLVLERRRRALAPAERARLVGLLRASGGRPGRLSRDERAELRMLIGRLDPLGAGREVFALRGIGKARGR